MGNVSLYRASDYDYAEIYEIIEKAIISEGGAEKLFQKGKKVVIKPNLVMKKAPEYAATTHPVILDALISYLKKYTDDITVAECPGGPNTEFLLDGIFKTTGIFDVAKKHNVKLSYSMEFEKVSTKHKFSCESFNAVKPFLEADVFINVGKLKTHALTTMTGSAKNLYGMIPGLQKVEYHARFSALPDFCRFLLDLNTTIMPDINILDGIDIMEGNGPTGGSKRHLGAILIGKNAFEVDLVAADLLGLTSSPLPLTDAAKEAGLIGDITVSGDYDEAQKICDLILPDSKKSLIVRFPNMFGGALSRLLLPRPVINSELCKGCGECTRLCPQKTIVFKKKKNKKVAYINKKNCIRCYCCQELCPVKAVDTKGFFSK